MHRLAPTWFRFDLIRLTALTLCAAAAWAADPPPAAGQPKLTLSAEEWNMGEVWYGHIEKFTLKVKNDGTAELKIHNVRPSCGCTAAAPAKTVLAPGEETTIGIDFDTKKKFGDASSSVEIMTNDPTRSLVSFKLKGFVKRAIKMTPIGGVVIRDTDPNGVHTARCRVENMENEPMTLKIVSANAPKFDVQVQEVTPGKVWDVVATSRPPLPFGSTVGSCEISTGLTREPQFTMYVQGNILRRVTAVPEAILIHADFMQASQRTVRLQYYGGDANFKVTGVKCSNPKITGTASPAVLPDASYAQLEPRPSKLCDVRIELPAGPEIPKEGSIVEIFTSDPDFAKLEIFVTSDAELYRHKMGMNRK
ncbi:hypothetical protein RAS1_32480 [Phycisphaerae bacterium RAS1]|nr:hypothetical protein RAS1_32480 [Phycisphaerae bacterium RAS1]